jgi:3-oxoacyl-[acyl-carrier protein] reductase
MATMRSKSARLRPLTRGMARDLGSRGITMHTVQPGPTETDMNTDENIRAILRPMLALGRLGKDSEIASLIT